MYDTISSRFAAQKRAAREQQLITESVLEIEEVLPGTEDEIENEVDVDSVPDEIYKKVDDALDKIVSDPNYDDTEAEELLDDDDEDDIDDAELDAIIDEAAAAYLDPEDRESMMNGLHGGLDHPLTPRFRGSGSMLDGNDHGPDCDCPECCN